VTSSPVSNEISISPRAGALAAAALAFLVYINSLGNGFALDDLHVVFNNEAIHSAESLPGALASPYWPGELGRAQGLWRPATTAVMGLTWILSAGSPFAFHLLNVLLHSAASATVVLVLARFTSVGAAALAGILFAVHPVHVEAVANVVGLGEVLSAFLFLLACLVWIDGSPAPSNSEAAASGGTEPTGPPRQPFTVPGPSRLLLVALLYAGAFLAKESAVVLPAVLLLLDAGRYGISLRELTSYARPRLGAWAILGVTAAAILSARYVVLWGLASPLPPPGASLLAEIPRIMTVAGAWPEYFRLLLFPVSLSSDYGPPLLPIVSVWTWRGVLGTALVLATLSISLCLCRWPRGNVGVRIVPLGVAWFCLTLAPVSNLLFLSGVLLAERTLYLPSVGFAMAAGWALFSLPSGRNQVRSVAIALVVVLLAGRTLARNPVWASTDTVMTRLILEHPEAGRAQWALGAFYEANGSTREANAAFRAALGRLYGSYGITIDIGRRLMNQGQYRAAETLLEQGLRSPDAANASELLAVLHNRGSDPVEAERWARLAVMHKPESRVTWLLLSTALEKQGRAAEAASAREKVIRFGESDQWGAWLALARLRRAAGDGAGAQAALDTARVVAGDAETVRRIDSLYVASAPRGP
jgi:tetratricopeptide (TPR) repeat protein